MKRFFTLLALCSSLSIQAQNVSFISTGVTGSSACLGQQTTFVGSSVYADTSILSWNWDLDNDGQYDDAMGKSIGNMFPQAGNFPVGLKVILKSGSVDSMPQPDTVKVNPLPQVNFTTDNLCEGQTAVLTSASVISEGSISKFYWDFKNDGTDNDSGSVVTFNCGPAEIYQTKLRCVSDMGCEAFAIKTTQVFNHPVAGFSVLSACLGGNTVFNNTSSLANENISYYLWEFGDGDSSALSNPTHVFPAAQTYDVNLTVISENFCRDEISIPVTIASLVNAGFTAQNACFGEVTSFTNNTSFLSGEVVSLLTYDFGDGTSGTSSGDITHEYSATGTYTVSLVAVSQNTCTGTFSATVSVNNLPVVSLEISGDTINDSTIYKGKEITLTVTGNASSFFWSDGSTAPNLTVSDSGTFSVTATNSDGCSEVLSKNIIVKEVKDTAVAGNDIITPNGDGINDVFMIMDVSAYKQCAINIYSIWNEEVYSSSGYKNDWAGKNLDGKDLDAGAYYFILKCDDQPQTIGIVNILR